MRSADGAPLELDIVEVPKSGGGVRAMTFLGPGDDARYRRLVARMVLRVDASLHAGVVANRVGSWDGSRGWTRERARWRLDIARALAAEDRPVMVLSDVRSCYASVRDEALVRGLARARIEEPESAALRAFLGGCRRAGVEGLPIGPAPSAVLANAVLAVADDALVGTGVRFARWVDDVVIVAPGASAARRAWDSWAGALREVGLHAHEGKTRLIADREEARSALLLGRSSLMPGSARGMMPAP